MRKSSFLAFVESSTKRSLRRRSISSTIKSSVNGNSSSYERPRPVSIVYSRGGKTGSSSHLGLPFAAFVEAFFLLSQRKYPHSHALIDSVSQLVSICIRHLNTCLQAPASPLIQQSNQYLLQRATRMNSASTINPSSMNHRSTIIALRSTTAATHRSIIAPSSAPTPRVSQSQHLTPSATAITSSLTADNKPKQTTKSVFPLFFDVL